MEAGRLATSQAGFGLPALSMNMNTRLGYRLATSLAVSVAFAMPWLNLAKFSLVQQLLAAYI
jgi:hypothetical protein